MVAGAITAGAGEVAHARVEAGLLTCEVSGGFALILSSPRELHCVFRKANGQSEAYAGSIGGFGLDLGVTDGGVMAWIVAAETTEVPPGALAGGYAGAEAGASVVLGVTGRLLVGGSERAISLQPLSVEGDVGLNVAVGVVAMELRPLFRPSPVPVSVSVPAVGQSYAAVPHALQAPHYGCGSYTHLLRGQTLSGLAHACGVQLEALLEANPQITDVRNVAAGAVIYLPTHANHRSRTQCGLRAVLHEDETLDHLAWRCGVTLHALLLANPSIRDVDMIRPGLVLAVPEPGVRPAPAITVAATAEHVTHVEVTGRPAATTTNADRTAAGGVRREQVHFAPGQTGTRLRGTITGGQSVSYLIGAEAGQTLSIALDASNAATYFNVYAPGSGPGDEALAMGGTSGPMVPEVNRFVGRLPSSGMYTVFVYQMRSAARRNQEARYNLAISVSALAPEARRLPVQRDFADGLQGGPDYWEVSVSSAGTLNLRAQPVGDSRILGHLRHGTVVRNLGCRMTEGRRWCHIETLSAPRLSGWSIGDALTETSLPLPAVSTSEEQAPPTGRFARPVGGVRPSGSGFTATGLLRCIRAAGQPPAQCDFGIVRRGGGNGVLTVFWPDGGTRTIFFENGQPANFDHSEADGNVRMSVARRDDLFTVTIGSQRFEFPEAVITGG
jgi:hypothetical protein